MRDYAWRRYRRYVKGMRRVREDRAQHGNPFYMRWQRGGPMTCELSCDCFEPDVGRGRGQVFARFADYPQICSSWGCCGNIRDSDGPTVQELRAPTVADWD